MARKRAGRTVKISVSVDRDDLQVLKRHAKNVYGGNLSAVLAQTAAFLKQQEARWKLIQHLGGPSLTPEAAMAIDAELAGGPQYIPRKKRAA